jgi:phospholipase/carboxylesterase
MSSHLWRGTPSGAPPLELFSTVNFDHLTGSLPPVAIILCHGYGADAADLFSLSEFLSLNQSTGFYCPNAPLELPAAFMSAGGRAWFEIDWQLWRTKWKGGPSDVSELTQSGNFLKSVEHVQNLISYLLARGVQKIILGGFSQGGMIALSSALSFLNTHKAVPGMGSVFAGLWLLSTQALDLKYTTEVVGEMQGVFPEFFQNCSVVHAHGEQDPILQFPGAEQLGALLKKSFTNYCWIPFRGGHEIPSLVLQKMGHELEKIS